MYCIQIEYYGVLLYVAPEVLWVENYSAASDVYSFGIIIEYTCIAKDICNGVRLEIPDMVHKNFMWQCWDINQKSHPTAP